MKTETHLHATHSRELNVTIWDCKTSICDMLCRKCWVNRLGI